MGGNTDMRHKELTTEGGGGEQEGGVEVEVRWLIEEIKLRVREMRKENNEKGSTE